MAGGSATSPRHSDPERVRRAFEALTRRGLQACSIESFASPLLVALSGGADSTALLLALTTVSPHHATHAGYIDHGLRSAEERERERDLVEALCTALGVPLHVRSVDVAAERRRARTSWEDAARRVRYTALVAIAREIGAGAVLTGHTRDDQAETVLLHLARGAGLRGLRGLQPATWPWGKSGPALLRPLLKAGHGDCVAYCRARGVPWCEDSTNACAAFARNRARHEVLPALEKLHPGAVKALARLAERVAEALGWIDSVIAERAATSIVREGEKVVLRALDEETHPFLAAELAALALRQVLDGPGPPDAATVQRLVDLWQGAVGRRLALPRGWRAEKTAQGVVLARGSETAAVAMPSDQLVRLLLREGETVFDGWTIEVQRWRAGDDVAGGEEEVFLPVTALETGHRLEAGYWQPGDRMRPSGMRGTKKLQDVFVDAKVPPEVRRRIPLIYLDGEVVWAVGVRRGVVASPIPTREEAVRLRVSRRDEIVGEGVANTAWR